GEMTLAYEGMDMEAEHGLTFTVYTAEPGSKSERPCVCSPPGPPVSTLGRRRRSIRPTRLTEPEPRRPAAAIAECVGSGLGDGIGLSALGDGQDNDAVRVHTQVPASRDPVITGQGLPDARQRGGSAGAGRDPEIGEAVCGLDGGRFAHRHRGIESVA